MTQERERELVNDWMNENDNENTIIKSKRCINKRNQIRI